MPYKLNMMIIKVMITLVNMTTVSIPQQVHYSDYFNCLFDNYV